MTPPHEEGVTSISLALAARARTVRSRDLQRLASSRLSEQKRFLTFQKERMEVLRTKHARKWRELGRDFEIKRGNLIAEQGHRCERMEERQLEMEMEAMEAMEAERRSVDQSLRHMEGYVNGRGIYAQGIKGRGTSSAMTPGGGSLNLTPGSFPARTVTSQSLHRLQNQRHVSNQLPQLHAARLRVLRDTQVKRLARLQQEQASQLKHLDRQQKEVEDELMEVRRTDEAEMIYTFGQRKDRMEWRWKVAEGIEKSRLESDRGVEFASLELVTWGIGAWKGHNDGCDTTTLLEFEQIRGRKR